MGVDGTGHQGQGRAIVEPAQIVGQQARQQAEAILTGVLLEVGVKAADHRDAQTPGGAQGGVRRADGTKHDDRQLALRGIEDAGFMRLKESRERSTDVGGGRLHGFELRGEFIAEQGDQSALKGGPAGETRGADFARPAPQIVERLLRSFFVGAVGGMHDHATIGEKDRRARRGGNGDQQGRGERLRVNQDTFSGYFWSGEQAIALGLADEVGSLQSVARVVVKQETLVDYTLLPSPVDAVLRRLSAETARGLGAGLRQALGLEQTATLR